MSGPTVTASDSVGGSAGGSTPVIDTTDIPPIETRTFKRIYEHYVSNSMDAFGYSEASTAGFVDSWQVDEGWHLIPYWNPAMGMSEQNYVAFASNAQAISVDKLSFKIKHAQMMRQEITVITGTTSINNTYASQPYFEVYEDDLHKYDDLISPRPATSTTFPIEAMGYSPALLPNLDMTCCEVPSMTAGMLKRSVIGTSNTGLTTWAADKMVSQAATGVTNFWSQFSTLNCTGRKMMSQENLTSYGRSWSAKYKDWYPISMPRQAVDWATFQGLNIQVPGNINTSRKGLMQGTAPQSTANTANPRGDNLPNIKHNMWQKINLETAVPSAPMDVPVDCFIKINRLYDQEGPINLYARILVEYEVTLSKIPLDTEFCNSVLVGAAAGGGDNGFIRSTLTTGMARRYSSWGIPNLASAKAKTSAYQRIYQPATLSSQLKRKRTATTDYEDDPECTDDKTANRGSTISIN